MKSWDGNASAVPFCRERNMRMKLGKWMKGAAALAAGLATLAATGIMAMAEPMGLSVMDGRTIRSRDGGFTVEIPEGYELTRPGQGGYLDMILESILGDAGDADFRAGTFDGEGENYFLTIGYIENTGSEAVLPSPEVYQTALTAGGIDPSVMYMDTWKLGDQNWFHIRLDYGRRMADEERKRTVSPEFQQSYEEYISYLENMMTCDIYMRQNGTKRYTLLNVYSKTMAPAASQFMASFKPYSGQEGWAYNQEAGWQYMLEDGQLQAGSWIQDEGGLTYHLDGSGRIQYNAWIEEDGRWKYVDELGHMVTSVTKTIEGTRYSFGRDGFLKEGSEGPAREYEMGTVEGKTYKNSWADVQITFPEAAELMLGDGSEYTYTLVGGEHVDPDDPELGYRLTFDITDADVQLDRYMDVLREQGNISDYTIDYEGTAEIGGYEYLACETSYDYGDGTAHHWNTYIRQIDQKIIEININYYDEVKPQAEGVFGSISPVQ